MSMENSVSSLNNNSSSGILVFWIPIVPSRLLGFCILSTSDALNWYACVFCGSCGGGGQVYLKQFLLLLLCWSTLSPHLQVAQACSLKHSCLLKNWSVARSSAVGDGVDLKWVTLCLRRRPEGGDATAGVGSNRSFFQPSRLSQGDGDSKELAWIAVDCDRFPESSQRIIKELIHFSYVVHPE